MLIFYSNKLLLHPLTFAVLHNNQETHINELMQFYLLKIERNSSRDTWKLANWDEYIAGCNFTRPDIDDLVIFKNSSTEEFNESIKTIVETLG